MTLIESLLSVMLLAAAGSLHCLGMCGAISINLTFSIPPDQRSPKNLLRWHLLFNAGRLSLYTLLGIISGILGSVLQAQIKFANTIIMMVSACILLLVALQLAGKNSGLNRLERLGVVVWKRAQPMIKTLLPIRHPWQAYLVGALWGLMPCGLIYSALAVSAAASEWWYGGLMMALFASITILPVASAGIVAGSLAWMRHPMWRYLAVLTSAALAISIFFQAVTGHNTHRSIEPAADQEQELHHH